MTAIKDSLHEKFDGCDPDYLGNLKYNDKFNHMVNLNFMEKPAAYISVHSHSPMIVHFPFGSVLHILA